MIEVIDGVRMLVAGDMVVRDHRRYTDGFEPLTRAAWREWLEVHPYGTVLDIGAYSGVYSLIAAPLVSCVVAFEPFDVAADRFEENRQLNGFAAERVALFRFAVGAETVRDCRLITRNPGMTSAGRVVRGGGSIDVRTIDEFCDDFPPVTAIKIDVEGMEPDVIMGARHTINTHKPFIVAECLDDDSRARLERDLSDWGYKFDFADGRNLLCYPPER